MLGPFQVLLCRCVRAAAVFVLDGVVGDSGRRPSRVTREAIFWKATGAKGGSCALH